MTVAAASTAQSVAIARAAAKAGADGLMVVPSLIYHTNQAETLATLRAVAGASDLPIMIYSNRVAYKVDITPDIMEELADDARFVAIKESSDDHPPYHGNRSNRLGDRYGHPDGRRQSGLRGAGDGCGRLGRRPRLRPLPEGDRGDLQACPGPAGTRRRSPSIAGSGRCLISMSRPTSSRTSNGRRFMRSARTTACAPPRQPLAGSQKAEVDRIVLEAMATRPEVPRM